VLISYNVRGLNSVGKQEALHRVIQQQSPHIICLNETKLQGPLFMEGYWAHQTELQRSGGCWTAACKGISLTLTKSLRTYLCWTKAIVGNSCIYVLNCYLEPGEDEQTKNRAARIAEIAANILKQDSQARIIVCGDFNK
jgi:exonuclease III